MSDPSATSAVRSPAREDTELDAGLDRARSAVPRRRGDLHPRVFDHEAVLYDEAHHAVHYLNQTAWFIWQRCDGQRSAETIAGELAEVFDVPPGTIDREAVVADVGVSLGNLAENGLIELHQTTS